MANVFSLEAKIGLDTSDYEKNLDKASGKMSGFASKIGSGLATAAKVGAAAIGAASAAVTAFTKQAIDGYAEYEQLVGGVETLFEDFSDDVIKNASEAYKTAGLSANEYMETVMGFSASLNQSLMANEGSIARAAATSDQIIRDMSDNANKMGTDMGMIQSAYAGFAKQNYTMLDNLKLGYGGTKTEMERLLADAEKISGKEFNVENFADIAEAIHIIQNEMGITGTTAKEASTTIEGSLNSLKSAWQNLVTGLGDKDADFESLINNVVDSAETAFGNILPVAETALSGIANLIEKLAPIIAEKLPPLVEKVLPSILAAATSLVNSLVSALPTILTVLMEQAPIILGTLSSTIIENLPMLLETALQIIVELANGLTEALPTLIPTVVNVISELTNTILDNLDMVIDAALALIMALADGLIEALPILIEKAPEINEKLIRALIRNAPKILEAAWELIKKLVEGLMSAGTKLGEVAYDLVQKLKDGIMGKVKDAKEWGKDLIKNFIDGITAKFEALKDKVKGVASTIKDFLGFSEPKEGPLSNFHTYAPDMMDLFIDGISKNESRLKQQLAKTFDFKNTFEASYANVPKIIENVKTERTIMDNMNLSVQLSLAGRTFEDAVVEVIENHSRKGAII